MDSGFKKFDSTDGTAAIFSARKEERERERDMQGVVFRPKVVFAGKNDINIRDTHADL